MNQKVIARLNEIKSPFNSKEIDYSISSMSVEPKSLERFLWRVEYELNYQVVLELSHVFITKTPNSNRFFIFRKGAETHVKVFTLWQDPTLEKATKLAIEHNDLYENKMETAQVEFPTGQVAFANYFSKNKGYQFDLPEYKEKYSVNFAMGRQKRMQKLSELHGLGYVQLETTTNIYQASPVEVVMANDKLSDDWSLLGTVDNTVWRVEFIDKCHEPDENSTQFCASLEKGVYTVENYYPHLESGDFSSVWCRIKKTL